MTYRNFHITVRHGEVLNVPDDGERLGARRGDVHDLLGHSASVGVDPRRQELVVRAEAPDVGLKVDRDAASRGERVRTRDSRTARGCEGRGEEEGEGLEPWTAKRGWRL